MPFFARFCQSYCQCYKLLILHFYLHLLFLKADFEGMIGDDLDGTNGFLDYKNWQVCKVASLDFFKGFKS